jgi:hypothetical protein
MALKTISYAFIISLAFDFAASIPVQDVPFDMNDVINQVSPLSSPTPNPCPLNQALNSKFLIDTNIFYSPAQRSRSTSSIAFDGTNYLVVWQDCRSGSWDIYGTRVNQEGQVLDTTGLIISASATTESNPSVAFDGTNYLVVWQVGYDTCDIYGALVNINGGALNRFLISTGTNNQINPAVAFDGTNYLVVWQKLHRSSNYDIYGARVDQQGAILDPGFAITSFTQNQESPSVAFDGTNYFVVWRDCRADADGDIYGTKVNQAGVVINPSGIPICTSVNTSRAPSITFGCTNYLVVWDDGISIFGARINLQGSVLDPQGFVIHMSTYGAGFPSVAFDDTNYLVVWEDEHESNWYINGSRVSQLGIVLDPNNIAISVRENNHHYPSVAFDGTNYLVVWDFYNSSFPSDIHGAMVSRTGMVIANDFLLSYSAYWQESSSVAFDGTNYLAVWQDYRYNALKLFGARISQQGTILDPQGFDISYRSNLQFPSVAFGDTDYLVVWQYNGHIYGTRVNQDGIVLDPWGISISYGLYPSVAFDGINYLVVWQYGSDSLIDIYGARVSQQGIVLDPGGIAISTFRHAQQNPSVIFGDSNYLVVWEDQRSAVFYSIIYGARVNRSGILLDLNGIAIGRVRDQHFPSVAFDGNNYLVVWEIYRSVNNKDIMFARVNQAGTVLDPGGRYISTATGNQESPSIAFDGANYLVVWQDYRSGYNYDIYGAKLNQSGGVIENFHVSTESGDQLAPAVTRGIGNEFLITYSGWTDSINHHPTNTMRIWGKFYPFIGLKEENSEVKIQNEKLLEVYPNPAKSFFTVRLPQSADRIKIFDVSGKLVKVADEVTSPQSHQQEIRISLKGINPGIYFLRRGKETKKFLVVK